MSKYRDKKHRRDQRAERNHGGGKFSKPRKKGETKRENKLLRRIRDYTQMVAQPLFKSVGSSGRKSYHQPGSFK